MQGPEYPEALDYLLVWLTQVHGRSGAGMNGPAPLNPLVLESMARLKGWRVTSDEADALLTLDAVLLAPGVEEAEDAD